MPVLLSAAGVPDALPNTITIPPVSDVDFNTPVISDPVTPTGFNVPLTVQTTGVQVSISNGPFLDQAILHPKQSFRLKILSSASSLVPTTGAANIGGVNFPFTVTTKASTIQVPTDILSDVALWGTAYDPTSLFSDDGVTQITNGGTVYRANDKGSHGYHLRQTSSTARPLYSTTSFFGSPGLTFDGINDALTAQGITLGVDKFALFISIAMSHSGSGRFAALESTASSNPDYNAAENAVLLADNGSPPGDTSTTLFVNTYRNNSGFTQSVDAAVPINMAVIYDGAHGKIYANGTLLGQNTAAGALGALCNFAIGAGYSAPGTLSSFGKCVVQSWCLARGDVTSGQRTAMETWLSSPTGVTRPTQSIISGLKALQTTGSMSAGSTTLTVANSAGFEIGDPIIVEVGGEADAFHAVGGLWPYNSFTTYANMLAGSVSDGDYAWVSTNADGHQGEVYRYFDGHWASLDQTYAFWQKVQRIALLATINGKSGNTLTLDTPSLHATANAAVYFNNQPILNALAGPDNTHFLFPDPGSSTLTYAIGGPSYYYATNIKGIYYNHKVGWTIDGINRAKTRLKTPRGVPTAAFQLANCTNCTLANLGMDFNLELGVAGPYFHSSSQPYFGDRAIYNPSVPQANVMSGCNDCTYSYCEAVNVFQTGFSASVCGNCWADHCKVIQTVPWVQYTQWLILWADCGTSAAPTTGGSRDCEIDCTYLGNGAEMFRSYGLEHTRLKVRNAVNSMNTTGGCKYDSPDVTINANCESPVYLTVKNNPIFQVNNNIGGSAGAGLGNSFIDVKIIQEGPINSNNDILAFFLDVDTAGGTVISSTSARRSTHVEDYKGYLQCPVWASPSAFRGADLRLNGAGSTISNMRIVGGTAPGLKTVSIGSGGTVQNCVLPDDGTGHVSIASATGVTLTNNITNQAWSAGG